MNLSIFEPPEGTPVFEKRDTFGIEFDEDRSRFWTSKSDNNTHTVRYFRYRLLRKLWLLRKQKKVSIGGWDFEYGTGL